MTDLTPITALGAQTARQETFGALTITENANLGIASLALRKEQEAPTVFGLKLPDVGKISGTDGTSAFWTSAGQWMIMGAGQGTSDFAKTVKDEAPACSVTEQTDGFAAFELTSDAETLERLMTKLVNLPASAFSAGCAARTGLEHMTVFLVRPSETTLTVIGMRTFADALWHALSTAAKRLET